MHIQVLYISLLLNWLEWCHFVLLGSCCISYLHFYFRTRACFTSSPCKFPSQTPWTPFKMINIPTEDTNCFEQPFKADQKNNLDVLMCYFIFFFSWGKTTYFALLCIKQLLWSKIIAIRGPTHFSPSFSLLLITICMFAHVHWYTMKSLFHHVFYQLLNDLIMCYHLTIEHHSFRVL